MGFRQVIALLGLGLLSAGNTISGASAEVTRPRPDSYEVKAGDTLFLIARNELGDGARWTEIAALNALSEPWTIQAGQRLHLPGAKAPAIAPNIARPAPANLAPARSVPANLTPSTSAASRRDASDPRDVAPQSAVRTPYPPIDAPRTEPWTLEEARARALRQNLTLRTQALVPRTALADAEVARAAFDPTLSADITRSWSRTEATRAENTSTTGGVSIAQTLPPGTRYTVSADHSRTQTITPTVTGTPSHVADVSVTVTQPLLEGAGRTAAYAGVNAAVEGIAAARGQTARRTAVIEADVDAAYWSLAEAEAAEVIARESLGRAETLLDRNMALLREGLLADVEVLTAHGGVASRREALIAAVVNRANKAEALLFLVEGEGAAARLALPQTATPAPLPLSPPDAAVLEARAIRDRPDLAAAAADRRAAEIRQGAAQNALLPDLDLTASAGTGGRAGRFGRAWNGASDNEEPSWSIGAALTVPIGNRADRARADAADAGVERQTLAQLALVNDIRLEVRTAHRDVTLGIARLDAALEAYRLAMARWGAEQKRLELGLGDTLRVLDAEQNAASSELTATRARFAVATAWARLRAAVPGMDDAPALERDDWRER